MGSTASKKTKMNDLSGYYSTKPDDARGPSNSDPDDDQTHSPRNLGDNSSKRKDDTSDAKEHQPAKYKEPSEIERKPRRKKRKVKRVPQTPMTMLKEINDTLLSLADAQLLIALNVVFVSPLVIFIGKNGMRHYLIGQ
jgi:hypothetical protein